MAQQGGSARVLQARDLHHFHPQAVSREVRGDVRARQLAVLLVTDSQYVMKGINEWMDNWKKRGWKTAAKEPVKNADLWKLLDEQVNRHNVTWKWVRGHIGHHGNERADQLANRGVDEVRGYKQA